MSGSMPPGDPLPDTTFGSRWAPLPPGAHELDPATLAPGFEAGSASAGIKHAGETDVGVVRCVAGGVASAILLTANASAAAPVRVCRDDLDQGRVRACIVNSGNANASTGEQGLADAVSMRDAAASALGLEPREVAVAETGTIGVPLEMERLLGGVEAACAAVGAEGGAGFAEAILTTDRFPKSCCIEADGVTLSVQAKGAGMMMPGFATMLCFIQTDALVSDPELELRRAVAGSFERISVDGQMSTNDTVLLQASGESGRELPSGLLDAALLALALRIVADGEGATRVARLAVSGARSAGEAELVARTVGNSPLVKTALFGRDPNWGRIAQAAGMALAGEELPELGPDRIDALELAQPTSEPEIRLDLGRGEASAHLFVSDLTHDYVTLNSEYTT
ncbi:bifunctional glutamate N-acetyltransferase/amino-acid acetyltransferase ArgJ [Thermoleophilia bacterium SCSIO 60948]|nr:bifunctional glutamate N-acetyltransferase/amino-acid acetyltransferase ArgJ [Thermoleophilia bacterium SCSIO 60948]